LEIEGVGHLHFIDTYDGNSFKVLVLDDDEGVLASVKDFLLLRGIDRVDTARSTGEASAMLDATKYDAILADVLLYNPDQERSGLKRGDQWILEQAERLESVFAAAVTGFPNRIENPAALRRLGIEIVRKGDDSEAALYEELARRAEVKREKLRERLNQIADNIRRVVLDDEVPDSVEPAAFLVSVEELATRLGELRVVVDAKGKGAHFEELAALAFTLIPGLTVVGRDTRLVSEEFDLVLENDIPGTFWGSLESPFFLVECKNEKAKTGSPDVSKFFAKLVKHRNLTRFGFLVSASGFTRAAAAELARYGATDFSVALIDLKDLHDLVLNHRRAVDWLKGIILRSLLR